MRKNNLVPNKGLSLSTAQSISNLCNQRAGEISRKLLQVNNYSKSVKVNGTDHIILQGHKLPVNVVDLIMEKADLHACQAFLMENMKAKETMLNSVKKETADISSVVMPERPEYLTVKALPQVTEEYGWEQLTASELCEFYEAEAYAAHIGQFIHDRSILAGLRNELPNVPAIEWMEIESGKKSPVTITVHHNSEDLLKIHEEFAAKHRQFEQRVNYYKAKVKNLTTEENARIAKLNADEQAKAEKANNDMQTTYETAMKKAHEAINTLRTEFEKTRQERIKEIANMRIQVDARFQKTIDTFLNQLSKEE